MKAVLLAVVSLLFSLNAYADSGSTISIPGATISILVGRAISNSVSDEKSPAWGVEQETPTARYGTWLLGYLNEGHQLGDKRDGIYAQFKAPYQFAPRVETSVSAGPYYTATTVTERDGIHYRDVYCLSLLASANVKYSLDEHWSTQFRWSHVMFTRENRHDADVFAVLLSYKPGK